MKKIFTKVLLLLSIAFVLGFEATAQTIFFSDIAESNLNKNSAQRKIIPTKYRTVSTDTVQLLQFLKALPLESQLNNRNAAPIIAIPMPDGSYSQFRIWETPMMEPGLAAKFQTFRTFTGQGITDPTANIKLDWTALGFHAMILSSVTGNIFIDPYEVGNKENYISYRKVDFKKADNFIEEAPIDYNLGNRPTAPGNILAVCIAPELRTYRLAVAATGEYTAFHGGTVVLASAAILTTVNRVSGVYEREVDVRLVLVANNDLLIYTNSGTDPYTNNNGSTMLGQNQTNITTVIGSANYDIGHVFSTGGGGIAGLGVVCSSTNKARGVTGSSAPVGDPFDIDYVAHEMGHQFGGNHTFNAASGSCSGNGNSGTNTEPGSGSTIMAYAGICTAAADLQSNSDAQFHAISFDEITAFITGGGGNSCPVKTNTSNLTPSVNAGADFTIPRSTPFVLTGTATDPNGDALTYSWEQMDTGGSFGAWNAPTGNAPLFRSFAPVLTGVRYFPKLSDVINNTTTIGEILPTYARTMNFRLTARDNRAGGGGVCFDQTAITVNAASGPFLVTNPNTAGITWTVGDIQTITWDVASTTASPISCANVSIELSTDGGLTYPVTILASTANDGTEDINVPNNPTTQARIRVKAVGNVFYDISNFNHTIVAASVPSFSLSSPATVSICSGTSGSTTLNTASVAGFTGTITFSGAGQPAGSTLNINPTNVAVGGSTVVTLSNVGAVPAGTYTVTITGVSGAVTKTRDIQFTIGSSTPPTTLTLPANNAIGVDLLPTFRWSSVAGATEYKLEISTSNTFSPIAQTITGIASNIHQIVTPLIQNTIYYWRVSATNSCGLSSPSTTGVFKTALVACTTTTSTDVPLTISSVGTVTVNSTLSIPVGVTISDLNVVGLVGTHSYINDLTFDLQSPTGTLVNLFSNICASENNFNLNLDDEAATTTFPCPPTGGVTIKPTSPLSAFDGQNSTGTWTLTINDIADQDGGSLTGWGLSICSNTATPIPVTWLDFFGKKENNNTTSMLNWRVNEYNNHHYEIERSIDGIHFKTIGQINAASTGNGMLTQYVFADLKPTLGRNFYRIKQVDIDGRFSYSAIINLVFDKVKTAWSVYPNPAKDVLNVYSNDDNRNVQLQLIDASGKLMYSSEKRNIARGQLLNITTGNLASGVYSLRISSDAGVRIEKVIKQ
ncbi:MAG: reprolysin-like metallopeptidase [Ferruginibacter sp.]